MKKSLVLFSLLMNVPIAFASTPSKSVLDLVKEQALRHDLTCNDESEISVTGFTSKSSESEVRFYIATCPAGAYNRASILFKEVPSLGTLAVPLVSPHFNEKNLKVIGWTADVVAGDLVYDPKTQTLTSFSKGRGLGDMSVLATYAVVGDLVVLRKYEYDGTDDLKMNPKVIFESKERLQP